MACKKHGYTNDMVCPACDLETIAKYEGSMTTPAPPAEPRVSDEPSYIAALKGIPHG